MFNVESILFSGENRLGQYQVAIIRHAASGWVPTVPPLNAYVTNYRLILYPQTRRKYEPAIIPSHIIVRVEDVELGPHKAVRVVLKTGHHVHMSISWSQGQHLAEAIRTMLTSPLGNSFNHKLSQQDLSRLIQFISHL